ncbi:MAG: cbb3-type cytochrome c oxidase subunit I [Sideroxyarcus sp.]|nr:cbb3-type cytochrome c oxidase subunit I [Sideroxyarcus sp.]
MENALKNDAGMRRLAAAWLLLALAALTLSTCFAVLVVAARTPLFGELGTSATLFRSALVLHVGLAVVVWFLAAAAGVWTMAAGRAGRVRWIAWGMATGGVLAMVLALFAGSSVPVLANYLPVLDSPLFLGGLALFLCGIAWCGVMSAAPLVRRLKSEPDAGWRIGALLSMAVALIALGALAYSLLHTGMQDIAAHFEIVAWGPGHVLQFVHVVLLMTAWIMLAESALGSPVLTRRALFVLLALAAAPALATPFIYSMYGFGDSEFRHAFTALMQWGAWPAAVLLAVHILRLLFKARRTAGSSAESLPLLLSILLFLLGCVFGTSIRSESTMVPAHYHGTVGAVTLAYMMLGYRLLPAFGVNNRAGNMQRLQPLIYGAGLLVLSSALAWSGWLGVPRKTLHVELIAQDPAYFAAMSLAGVGGLLAIAGAALFAANILRTMRAAQQAAAPRRVQRDVRPRALGWALGAVLTGGALIAWWPSAFDGEVVERSDIAQQHKEEIDRRFLQGVAMLHAKQFDYAATAFDRVLELAPNMPEAHVNMGYALIGVGRYDAARDFFEAATRLRVTQVNAYYGLAIALEGSGDLPGALGAMRSYVHLAHGEDAYVRKAQAAIGEWEGRLRKATSKQKLAKNP